MMPGSMREGEPVRSIHAALLDLQGVLYAEGAPYPGATNAVASLLESRIGVRFLTNTTTRPRRVIAERMTRMGFEIAVESIFTPAVAAVGLLRGRQSRRIMLAADDSLAEDFASFELVEDDPDAVVMGDLYTAFDWPRLNRIFGAARRGAALIGLHRNRYCRRGDDIALDLGPFVAAIEYASGVSADVVGKPDPAFFALALADLECASGNAVMVGDDPFSDIDGGADAGLRTIQVKTGKYVAGVQGRHGPDHTIDSVADLPGLLGV